MATGSAVERPTRLRGGLGDGRFRDAVTGFGAASRARGIRDKPRSGSTGRGDRLCGGDRLCSGKANASVWGAS